jgi:hypothetical protein
MVTGSVDDRIFEPEPFDTKYFSHKFKGPGLCFKIAMSLEGCDTVHAKCKANPIFEND